MPLLNPDDDDDVEMIDEGQPVIQGGRSRMLDEKKNPLDEFLTALIPLDLEEFKETAWYVFFIPLCLVAFDFCALPWDFPGRFSYFLAPTKYGGKVVAPSDHLHLYYIHTPASCVNEGVASSLEGAQVSKA